MNLECDKSVVFWRLRTFLDLFCFKSPSKAHPLNKQKNVVRNSFPRLIKGTSLFEMQLSLLMSDLKRSGARPCPARIAAIGPGMKNTILY